MNDPIAHLDEATKHIIDVVSILTVVGTLVDMLPSFAAFLTVLWTLIRIYETDTVQRILGKTGGRRIDDEK
jgi:hypothetical protein